MKKIIAMLAVLAVALLGIVLPAYGTAGGGDEPCQTEYQWSETDPGSPWVATGKKRIKPGTEGTYTEWVDDGDVVRTEENAEPVGAGEFVNWEPAGTVDDSTTGGWNNTVVTFYTWNGGNYADAPPVYSDDSETALHPDWNETNGNPQGGPHASAPLYTPYEAGNGPSTASWFLKAGVYVEGNEDTDYLWQKQVRESAEVNEFEYKKECPTGAPEVTPEWKHEIKCPISEVTVTPNENYTYEVDTTRGRLLTITFTALGEYVFTPSERYEVSDDGKTAIATVFLVIPRCPVDNPEDPEDPDNPVTPDDPKDPREPKDPVNPDTPDVPTSVPAGSECLGGALVTKSTDAKGNTTTSTENGHPACDTGEVFKEEGM